jgi:uncharacterized protein DUF4340
MPPRKLLILTAVVLALFGFIVLFERKMPSTSEQQQKADLVWEIPQDQIESLRLERGNSVVELKKAEGAGWKIVKPEPYPADDGAVGDVLSQLARLRRTGTEMAEARPEDYGFKSPSARATIVWKNAQDPKKRQTRTLELGIDIPGTDAVAAREGTSPRVVFVPTSVATAVKKSVDDFKSKELFHTTAADAARLDVERGRGKLSLARKNGFWWLSQPFTDLADDEAVQRLIGDLTALRVLEFLSTAERQNLASLGLSPPLYRVTVADTAGTATTVEFGATRSDGNTVYGRRENQAFTVGSSITEELSKEGEAFRDTHLVRFDRAQATAISGSFGSTTYALERRAGEWNSSGKPVAAAAVDDLLTAIIDLKSRAFTDDSDVSGKGRQPEATLDVRLPTTAWTIRVFPFPNESRVSVSGRPGAFALASDPTASLQAAFQKAVAPVPPAPAPKATTPKKP